MKLPPIQREFFLILRRDPRVYGGNWYSSGDELFDNDQNAFAEAADDHLGLNEDYRIMCINTVDRTCQDVTEDAYNAARDRAFPDDIVPWPVAAERDD